MTKTDTMAIAAAIRSMYEAQNDEVSGLELAGRRSGIRLAARAVADALHLHAKDCVTFLDFAIPDVTHGR